MAEEGPRDWSPRATGRKRGEVLVKILDNLGDRHPLDYGGLIVYRVRDTKKSGPHNSWVEADFWYEPLEVDRDDPEKDQYEVYRFTIEPDVFKELSWVGAWDHVAESAGIPDEELLRMGQSGNPLDRARVYEAVGRMYGFENLDSYPERYTRKEMEKRWPEFA